MSYRTPEPEAHCYDCPNSKNGGCAEFNALNPGSLKLTGKPYDRGHCYWGYELIHKLGVESK
jgi:hypothetical protein